MKNLPTETIWKQNGLGDTIPDIIESFNIDLTSNYKSMRNTRMKMVMNNDTDANMRMPYAFGFLNGNYYFFSNGFGAYGSTSISDSYTTITDLTTTGQFVEQYSDVTEFQGLLYSTSSSGMMKGQQNTWDNVGSVTLTAVSPHLLEVLGDRLYITNAFHKVASLSKADVFSSTGTYTLDLGLNNLALAPVWTITMLKSFNNTLWIGLLNVDTGKGLVFEWDGITENTVNNRYDLESGVMSGYVMGSSLYIVDLQGKLLKYNGGGFTEVARLYKKTPYHFDGIDDDNLRYIHPNGMCATDYGTLLILVRNDVLNGNFENTVPSGIYEYEPSIGLYHKYSISTSPVGGTTYTDYGQQRLVECGALFFAKPTSTQTGTDNGTIMAGARYYADATTSKYGLFCDDTLDTTLKNSYFITEWLESDYVDDIWQKAYPIYKKLLSQNDKIVVKYRTEEDFPLEATITWADIDRFTTVTDVSSYTTGDEVQFVQGKWSGMTVNIVSNTFASGTYTVVFDAVFPDTYDGTAKALFSKWIHAGDATYNQKAQQRGMTIANDNVSPRVQFKIKKTFTGKNELRKLHVVNKTNIKE